MKWMKCMQGTQIISLFSFFIFIFFLLLFYMLQLDDRLVRREATVAAYFESLSLNSRSPPE